MQAQVAELEASSMELHEVPTVSGAALFNGSRCSATSFCARPIRSRKWLTLA